VSGWSRVTSCGSACGEMKAARSRRFGIDAERLKQDDFGFALLRSCGSACFCSRMSSRRRSSTSLMCAGASGVVGEVLPLFAPLRTCHATPGNTKTALRGDASREDREKALRRRWASWRSCEICSSKEATLLRGGCSSLPSGCRRFCSLRCCNSSCSCCLSLMVGVVVWAVPGDWGWPTLYVRLRRLCRRRRPVGECVEAV